MTRETSNSTTLRWLAIAAVVCGGLLWFALTRKPAPPPATTTEPVEPQATPLSPASVAPVPRAPVVEAPAPVASAAPRIAPPELPPPPVPPRPRSALQAAFEREVPDSSAGQAESRIREIFKQQPDSDIVFRHVICTRSVCKIDLRWSPELSDSYNGGLIKVVEEFSRELSLEPEDPVTPETPMPVPMVAFIARKGYSIEGLLAEEAAAQGR